MEEDSTSLFVLCLSWLKSQNHVGSTAKFCGLLGMESGLEYGLESHLQPLWFLLFRNRNYLGLFISWTLSWGYRCLALMEPLPLFQCTSGLTSVSLSLLAQFWTPALNFQVLFFSSNHVLYFFLPHLLFSIVDLHESNDWWPCGRVLHA